MICTKRIRCFTALTLSLLLPVLMVPALSVQAAPSSPARSTPRKLGLSFKAPNRGAPSSTTGGATRGGVCSAGNKALLPLVPQQQVGLTFSDRPSFFLYMPPSPNQTAEFLLLGNDDTEVVYQTTFSLPTKAGIVRFDLPTDAPALQVGKQYHWYVTLICDTAKGPSGNPSVEGWVERTEPSSQLAKAIKAAKPANRPALYAEAGVWHETVTTLADLRRRDPNNPKLLGDWKELMKSVGLDSVAAEPLFDCCLAKKQ
ncbi:DUF928 domain-containing protein [Kovacikia minuta CCNUW1]|uniref:DUF928 domain-containing protein n=1 Tax=Kovacikia minuta TaxID=2931930 RepID=UPI001CC99985|nr:DUF928 domain-containing protein [Kovacikia minuta]UBF23759.1 DUF928 domain-containing protein [Kovacikia minuta CCNUW1]